MQPAEHSVWHNPLQVVSSKCLLEKPLNLSGLLSVHQPTIIKGTYYMKNIMWVDQMESESSENEKADTIFCMSKSNLMLSSVKISGALS